MHKNTLDQLKIATVAIENKVVQTNQYVVAKNAIDSLSRFVGIKSIGIMLLAETGLGKSTVLQKFVDNNLERLTAEVIASANYEFTPLPIIKFEMPEQPTVIAVCKAILTEAEHPSLAGTEIQLTNRVDKLIQNQHVRYLIIDECQHLLPEHAGKRTQAALNFIKNRMNKHKIILIVAGVPSAEKALSKYEELKERLDYKKCYINEFSLNTKTDCENFASFLAGFDNMFKDIGLDICDLYSDDMFKRIFLACGGSPRKFKYLLFKVLEEEHALGKTVNKRCFDKAYRDQPYNHKLGTFNPFSATDEMIKKKLVEFKKIKLDEAKYNAKLEKEKNLKGRK